MNSKTFAILIGGIGMMAIGVSAPDAFSIEPTDFIYRACWIVNGFGWALVTFHARLGR